MSTIIHQWIDRVKDLFAKGSFVRHAGILAGGTVVAQGVTMAALPVLTRLYSPEDFNLLASFAGVVSILTVVSSLRYNMAIPLPQADEEGFSLTVVALGCTAIISSMIALLFLIAPEAIGSAIRQPELVSFLWLVPIGVFVASTYNALQFWVSRKKQFGLVARTRMTRSVGGAGTQIGYGLYAPSPFGLVLGQIASEGLGIVGLARNILREDRQLIRSVSLGSLRDRARDYRRFPLYSGPEALFDTAAAQIPIILIAAAALGPEAGFLLVAMRVMGIPTRLIGSSVAQVFVVEAPEKLRKGELHSFTLKTLNALLKVGSLPMLLVGAVAPWVFGWVFGPEWTRAGWLVAWLTPMFILQFAASPMSLVLHVIGRLKLAMWMQVFGLVFRVGSIAAVAAYYAGYLSEAFAIAGAIYNAVFIMVILHAVKRSTISPEQAPL